MPHAIIHIGMHAWLPIGPKKGIKQLVLPTIPQGVVCIHHQLHTGYEWRDIHLTFGQGGCSQKNNLQFIAAHLISLLQLSSLVILVHNLGQLAQQEVVNQ